MTREEITICFDLDNKKDRRIFTGMKRLTEYTGEKDFSKAFIKFMDDLMATLVECEEKKEECENMLKHFLGRKFLH
ncbi:hypothetical protein AYK25_09135 [Thermoplasmatales archaeon SM1-50]|nr:MAG: hypothetical protein AYK25_09135 [Thermoplasmatales archaeon SM1-50]